MPIKAVKRKDRFGNTIYVCPLCGHVFKKGTQYSRHVLKSHIFGGFKGKRNRKKLEKYLNLGQKEEKPIFKILESIKNIKK